MSAWYDEYIQVAAGVTLHTRVRTPAIPSNLPTLVLLHFWGGSNATWVDFSAALDSRISLVVPSLRGWGQSSKDVGPDSYKMLDYAHDIVSLVDDMSKRHPALVEHGIVLAGHSLGGKIALQLATNVALDERLRALVLVAPSPPSGFDFNDAMLERMRHAFITHDSAREIIRTAMLGKTAAAQATLVSQLADDAMQGATEAVVAFPNYGAQENFETDLVEAVKKRTGQGRRLDALVLEGGERLEGADTKVAAVISAAGAHVKYERIQCGHLVPVEAPQQLAKAVCDFVLTLV